MTTQKFYAFGNGSFGCLYDHVEGPFLTADEAAEVAGDMFELNAHGVQLLIDDGILALQAVHDMPITDDGEPPVGADYIEVFEVDEHWTPE